MNTTAPRPFRATRAASAAALVAALAGGLLAGCGASAAEPEATVAATLSAPSDAASGGSATSGSGDESAKPGADSLSYAGRTGSTALELLLEADPSAEVSGEGENAFVTGIGGRVADDSASEFWSLSVDGEPAQVGAGTLETEDGQEITWTIETY